MYGAPPGSPLHNTCIPSKAFLVRMLQVSRSFSLIRSEKKRHSWQTCGSIVNPRASWKKAYIVGQETLESCKNLVMLHSFLVASQLLRTLKHWINFAITVMLLVHPNKFSQSFNEHIHSRPSFYPTGNLSIFNPF